MKEKIKKLEQRRAQQLHRDRQNFHQWLRTLSHEQKEGFYRRVMHDAPDMLPRWDHDGSPFDHGLNDPRVQEWLSRLEMQIDVDDKVDTRLHRIAVQCRREITDAN